MHYATKSKIKLYQCNCSIQQYQSLNINVSKIQQMSVQWCRSLWHPSDTRYRCNVGYTSATTDNLESPWDAQVMRSKGCMEWLPSMNKLTPSAATYATWQIRTKRNDLSTAINWGLAALMWPNAMTKIANCYTILYQSTRIAKIQKMYSDLAKCKRSECAITITRNAIINTINSTVYPINNCHILATINWSKLNNKCNEVNNTSGKNLTTANV